MKLSEIRSAMSGHVPAIMETKQEHSVLLPLVERAGELCLLYEKRADGIRQAGEVCFPGGRLEPGETPLEGVMREFSEELGLTADDIEVLGQFDTQVTFSHLTVFTFVGILKEGAFERMRPGSDEVARVFAIPLSFLLSTAPREFVMPLTVNVTDEAIYDVLELPDRKYSWAKGSMLLPVWKYDGEILWGITGRITKRFLEFITAQNAVDKEACADG